MGCNNTVGDGLRARAIPALSNNETMIAWLSVSLTQSDVLVLTFEDPESIHPFLLIALLML